MMNPILQSWKKSDYFLFFIFIPAFLSFMYLLPENIKNYFILDTSNPTILSIFFSNYEHVELLHFGGNLSFYLVVIFFLFNIEINKKIFRKSSVLIFIILPFISSILLIYRFPNFPPSLGFSAIGSAFMGYAIYSIFYYIKNFYYFQLNYSFLYLIIIINLIAVEYNLKGHPFLLFLKIISFLLFIILIYFNRIALKEISIQIIIKTKNIYSEKLVIPMIYNCSLFVLVIYFMFYLPYLIPSKITEGSGIINIFSHYIGYIFGLFVPFIITMLLKDDSVTIQ